MRLVGIVNLNANKRLLDCQPIWHRVYDVTLPITTKIEVVRDDCTLLREVSLYIPTIRTVTFKLAFLLPVR